MDRSTSTRSCQFKERRKKQYNNKKWNEIKVGAAILSTFKRERLHSMLTNILLIVQFVSSVFIFLRSPYVFVFGCRGGGEWKPSNAIYETPLLARKYFHGKWNIASWKKKEKERWGEKEKKQQQQQKSSHPSWCSDQILQWAMSTEGFSNSVTTNTHTHIYTHSRVRERERDQIVAFNCRLRMISRSQTSHG